MDIQYFKCSKEDFFISDEKLKERENRDIKLDNLLLKLENEDYVLYSEKKFILNEIDRLIYNDLFLVGKTKALGYLPISTINKYGRSIKDFKDYANKNNLGYVIINNCRVWSGSMYIYDKKELKRMLHKYKDILKKSSIPFTTLKYIDYISKHVVNFELHPDAFIVIGKTFNDSRFSKIELI